MAKEVVVHQPAPALTGGRRIVAHLVVATLAVSVAVVAAWVSRAVWRPGAVSIPWGLALSVAGSAACVWLARSTVWSLGFTAAGGWIVGLAAMLAGGPGGDALIIADSLGYAFILVGTGAVVVTAGWRSWTR